MDKSFNLGQVLESLVHKLTGWFQTLIDMLPNLVLVLIIAVIIWRLSRAVTKLSRHGLQRVTRYEHIARLLARLAGWAVLFFGFTLILNILHLTKAVATLLAGVGILGLALGFAGQDLAANFMAGLMLTFRHPFRTGDLVQTGDFFGHIEDINLRSTNGLSLQGQKVTIPNKTVLGNPIINYTITGERRVDLSCGVAYGDDLQQAGRAFHSGRHLDRSLGFPEELPAQGHPVFLGWCRSQSGGGLSWRAAPEPDLCLHHGPGGPVFKKGKGKETKLCFMGHVLMENRHGLIITPRLTASTGTAEWEAAEDMVEAIPGRHRLTLGGDKAYDTHEFVQSLRALNAVPKQPNSKTHLIQGDPLFSATNFCDSYCQSHNLLAAQVKLHVRFEYQNTEGSPPSYYRLFKR
jgi:hypothetical protein